MPKIGSIINTPRGKGEVIANSVVKEIVKAKVALKEGEEIVDEFSIYDVALISGGYEGSVSEDEIKIEVDESIGEVEVKQLFKDN